LRKPEYLSPSAIKTFLGNAEDYYIRYLSDNPIPNEPQNQPMSIGSAFDAYAKSWLHENLFGKGNDPKYSFEALFEAQVEKQNRDWARQNGLYAFDCYKQSGALSDLLLDLRKANGDPRFEFKVQGAVHGYREGKTTKIEQVILHGRPDVAYINAAGYQVVLDFKVNGYCSNSPPSPMPGYLRLRAPGRTNLGSHKDCQPMVVDGLMINISTYLENLGIQGEEWATQLAIYHWLLGSPFCSHTLLVGIDQIVCNANKGALPEIRVAEHRLRISKEWQQRTFDIACHIWSCIHSDHFFRDLTLEQSQARCAVLDKQLESLQGDGSLNDNWLAAVSRGKRYS
jgi:hypothetical protein